MPGTGPWTARRKVDDRSTVTPWNDHHPMCDHRREEMPQYVYIVFGVAILTLPLAVWAPPPPVPRRAMPDLCVGFMVLGVAVLVASALLPLFDIWFGAVAAAAGSLIAFHLMFWAARDRRDRGEEDDAEGGGGGGGPRKPEQPREPRGGLGIDWDEFDRHRHGWERDRTPEHEPVLV